MENAYVLYAFYLNRVLSQEQYFNLHESFKLV